MYPRWTFPNRETILTSNNLFYTLTCFGIITPKWTRSFFSYLPFGRLAAYLARPVTPPLPGASAFFTIIMVFCKFWIKPPPLRHAIRLPLRRTGTRCYYHSTIIMLLMRVDCLKIPAVNMFTGIFVILSVSMKGSTQETAFVTPMGSSGYTWRAHVSVCVFFFKCCVFEP